MKKQWSWGTWIVISFILFGAGTFTMVYISMNESIELVSDDYYEQELRYQDHIDAVKSTNAQEAQITATTGSAMLTLSFPQIGARDTYAGTIQFFRPSDKKGDFQLPLVLDSAYGQRVPSALLAKGLWRIKVSWSVGKQEFYSELPLMMD